MRINDIFTATYSPDPLKPDEVQAKIRRLKVRPALSVRTVLVYDGELDMRIEADHAFDFVIPSSLLVNGIREK